MPRPRRSNHSRQSWNARRMRNIANEMTEEAQGIAREERRVSMARLRASQSQEQSEAARETARLRMRNQRANNRDEKNYEKALESLKEAARCLGKSSDPESGTQTLAIQEQSTFVKRFIDVKKTLQSGDINAGVVGSEQLIRSVNGRPGLISEEKVLKLVLQYASDHPEAEKLQMRLNAIQKPTQEDSHTTDSPEQSIEEDLN